MDNKSGVDLYLEKRIRDKEALVEMCNNDINSGKLSEAELKDRIQFRDHCIRKINDYKERLERK